MFKHILVPLDGSSLAEGVLSHVAAMARAFESKVVLLHVLEQPQTFGWTQPVDLLDWQLAKAEAEVYLGQQTYHLQEMGLQVENVLLEGQAAERIIEFAHGQGVDLIMLSSHGRSGLNGWSVSSVVQKIILQARISIMIVRAYQIIATDLASLRYRCILVPLDGSQRAECVLPIATTLAQSQASQLLLAHVVNEPEMPRRAPLTPEESELVNRIVELNQQEAAAYLEQLQSRLVNKIEIRLLVSSHVTRALHQLVEENVDLVILSAHGYSGETKWPYGSVAISFIAYGTTPLLIVQDLDPAEMESSQAEVAAREYKGH